jgi:hypothetical protein
MDINDNTTTPTANDKEITDLLAGLNQDKSNPETTSVNAADVTVEHDDNNPSNPSGSDNPNNPDSSNNSASPAAPAPSDANPVGSSLSFHTTPILTTPDEPEQKTDADASAGADPNPDTSANTDTPATPVIETKETTEITPNTDQNLDTTREKVLGHLKDMIRDNNDQPSEDKFNTILSAARSTKDKSLLTDALSTAEKINDPGVKMKAFADLLQLIDEFTTEK